MGNFDNMDDVLLIQRYAEAGDREALGEFFRRHSDLAFRTACRVMQNRAEAEDAVQAAFIKIMQVAGDYRGGVGVRSWVAQIVVNTSRDMIKKAVRRRGREEYVADERGDVMESAGDPVGDLARQIKMVLEELPEKYRMPIWLHHYEGLAFHEVARALDVAEGTVRSQVSRGMEMLREALERAKVPVSAAALVGLLATLPAETASAAVVAQIDALLSTGAAGGAGAGVAGSAGSAAATAGKAVVFGKAAGIVSALTGSAVLMGAAFYLLRQRDPGPAPAGASPPEMLPSRQLESRASPAVRDRGELPEALPMLDYRWDFDSVEMPAPLKVFRGGSRMVSSGGVDDSGCLEIGDGLFEMLLDIPIDRLPVLVSFQRAFSMPTPELKHMTALYWMGYGPSALFHGIVDVESEPAPKAGAFGRWHESRFYVTRQYVDCWTDSTRHSLTVGEPVGDFRLRIAARGKHRIDNLVIRSIALGEVPDVSAYLNALAKVPPEKRIDSVILPELRPGRDFPQVSVQFAPAQIIDPALVARLNGLPWPDEKQR